MRRSRWCTARTPASTSTPTWTSRPVTTQVTHADSLPASAMPLVAHTVCRGGWVSSSRTARQLAWHARCHSCPQWPQMVFYWCMSPCFFPLKSACHSFYKLCGFAQLTHHQICISFCAASHMEVWRCWECCDAECDLLVSGATVLGAPMEAPANGEPAFGVPSQIQTHGDGKGHR